MKFIKVEMRGPAQWVILNRPDKRNAFHPEMIQEMTDVFRAAKARMIVLSGEGESFCAGGDLDWMKSTAAYSEEENRRDSEKLYEMYDVVRNCPIPIVGKAHGHAMGGGLGLLSVCDIVAAESKTQFCFSEVKWGLVPAVISSFVLEKVTPAKAREWMLTGSVFAAPEALQGGLIHFEGEKDAVDEFIDKTTQKLLQAGPRAIGETKKLLRFLETADASAVRKKCTEVIAAARVSEEGQSGLKAFLEKKRPPWA